MSDLRISGVGYEGLTVEALIFRLRVRGVMVLIDVRLNAISRKRGFSKRALDSALDEAGITYMHLPELGNQRENRAGYREVGTMSATAARETFRSQLGSASAKDALERVAEISSDTPVALFCFEADEQHCHREQVLEALRNYKVPVTA